MMTISRYLSDRTSLSFVAMGNSFIVAASGVKPNGEAKEETFTRSYTDGLKAVKVYNKLRDILKIYDSNGSYTTLELLNSYAEEAAA